MKKSSLSRRTFIGTAGSAAALFNIVPSDVLYGDNTPSKKINMAFIGTGGRAGANIRGCASQNAVAFCDVDEARVNKKAKESGAPLFKDFRVMLDKMHKEIDAVSISTPDHTHFAAAMAAMERGKHVFVQKPLAHNIWQLRTLRKAAKHYKAVSYTHLTLPTNREV